MANGNKEVSKSRPCPICGKTDYCCFWTNLKGVEQVICKRSNTQQDVTGTDGRVYKFLRLSKEGEFTVYQDKEVYEMIREREKDDWMRANQKGPYNPRFTMFGKFRKKKDADNGAVVAPVIMPAAAPEPEKVDWIDPLPHKELDQIYRSMLSHLILDDIHREYLKKEGWDDTLIEQNMIRSFPEKDFIRMKYKNFYSKNLFRKKLATKIMNDLDRDDLCGVPGAFIDKGGNWTFNGPKGILFPIYDGDGLIYGLRIRMDFMDPAIQLEVNRFNDHYYEHEGIKYYLQPLKGWFVFRDGEKQYLKENGYWTDYNGTASFKEVKGKYRPLTSYYEDEVERRDHNRSVNIYEKGCQLPSGTSLYFHPEKDNPVICYLTEGEKKGIFGNALMQSPVVTFPGVDSWGDLFCGEKGFRLVDKMKARGTKLFLIAYDADKEVNERVLRAQQKVMDALVNEGFSVGVCNWNMQLGKGLDDLLSKGYLPSYDIL